MLKSVQLVTTLPATDLGRAKKFYQNNLGFKVLEEREGVLLLSSDKGAEVTIYQRPTPTKADHTVMTFEVKGLKEQIKDLEKNGVQFEEYDMPEIQLKTKDHIASMEKEIAAWFKDSEGNIICLHESLS
jgi:catechol-2,3-dioxygenase